MRMIFFLGMLLTSFWIQGKEMAAEVPRVEVKITPPGDVKYKKGEKIPDLIITANYRSCVILAEIARVKKDVPYILLPAIGEEKGKIHFIPARKEDIFSVSQKDLGKFIAFLAPERIIILGDELMVPRTCRPVSTQERRCLAIASGNWKLNSLTLGNILLIREMPSLYEKAWKNKVTDPLSEGLIKIEKKEKNTAEKKS